MPAAPVLLVALVGLLRGTRNTSDGLCSPALLSVCGSDHCVRGGVRERGKGGGVGIKHVQCMHVVFVTFTCVLVDDSVAIGRVLEAFSPAEWGFRVLPMLSPGRD